MMPRQLSRNIILLTQQLGVADTQHPPCNSMAVQDKLICRMRMVDHGRRQYFGEARTDTSLLIMTNLTGYVVSNNIDTRVNYLGNILIH